MQSSVPEHLPSSKEMSRWYCSSVIGHSSLVTIHFPNHEQHFKLHHSIWNFIPKLNSKSYSWLFVFGYLHSDWKEKADFHTLFLNKLKNRAPFVLKLAFEIEDKMLKQKLDSKFNMKLAWSWRERYEKFNRYIRKYRPEKDIWHSMLTKQSFINT